MFVPSPGHSPSTRRARLLAALVVSASLLAAGCGSDDGSLAETRPPTTSISTTAAGDIGGWTPDPIVWSQCVDAPRYDCATLQVPIDWSEPSSGTIPLAVTRSAATGDRIGTLFLNPGGPGGSGIQFLHNSSFNAALGARFDLVSWDPRGVGESAGLTCGDDGAVEEFLRNDPDPDTPEEVEALFADAEAIAVDCERPGTPDARLLAHLGTDDVARDLEALRLAVGDEQLTYLGFSYGTLIGQRYLEQFPTSVRAMVLDGVVDPTLALTEWLTGQALAFETSIQDIFDACGSDCPVDDLGAAFDTLKATLEKAPLSDGKGKELGPAELETAAVFSSYDPTNWDRLADGIARAIDGDPSALLGLARQYYDFGGFTSYVSVSCTDTPHPVGAAAYGAFIEELSAKAPRIGGMIAAELAPCAFWPVEAKPLGTTVAAPGAPAVLVIGTTGDAATPYANAERVAEGLESGVLVTLVGDGHTAYGKVPCITNVVDAYLLRLTVPDADPRCSSGD
ncbi:MAG: alpha/beta hydrolase [Actinobacteria bacterium]|nr:alpha/beta hydrolase [Actinomycetota bacterium]